MEAPADLLKGKVAIVTGAGGGIGRAVALRLAACGARVVVNDLGVSVSGGETPVRAAEAVASAIEDRGGQAVANTLSVADPASADAMVAQALDAFGRLDIVVNNAGIIRMGAFAQMPEADWRAVLATNLYGAVYLSRAAAPHFKAQGSGAYVHMSSASGLIGSTKQANYAAAKLGIAGLSATIARDLGPFGVRSNCIVPSSTSRMTDLTDNARAHLMTPEALETLKRARAASTPEHMAPVVAFLASDLGAHLNGQLIGARGSEIYLYGRHRPRRTLNAAEGWTPQRADARLPDGFEPFLTPLEVITDVFSWTPG